MLNIIAIFIHSIFAKWLVTIFTYVGTVEVFTWIMTVFNKDINPGFWFWFISIIVVSILFWFFWFVDLILHT
ncbi:hypothetical protein ES703_23984 [subsurface metagenome]